MRGIAPVDSERMAPEAQTIAALRRDAAITFRVILESFILESYRFA
jgi:hypothetical protein